MTNLKAIQTQIADNKYARLTSAALAEQMRLRDMRDAGELTAREYTAICEQNKWSLAAEISLCCEFRRGSKRSRKAK